MVHIEAIKFIRRLKMRFKISDYEKERLLKFKDASYPSIYKTDNTDNLLFIEIVDFDVCTYLLEGKQMNEEMIKIWNSVITSDKQTVYVNGDFCFGNKTRVKEIFDRLNGRKRIVLGNHDRCKFNDYYDIGFDRVYDKPILLGNFCILSHEPIQWIKDGDVYMNVYAHVHTQEMYKDYTSNSFCTSAERLNYKPIRFTEIFEKCQTYSKTVASD